MKDKIYESLIKCINFMADNKLIVKIKLRNRLYDYSLLTEVKRVNNYLTFERANNNIAYFNEHIHSIKLNRNIHYINKLFFEDEDTLISDIDKVFNSLSKNKQKKFIKIVDGLENSFSISKMQKFFLFLQDNFNFYFSSVYGFDGCTFTIVEIYNYDSEGMKKFELQKVYNSNKKEIVKLEKMIERLREENEGLKEKIKQNTGKMF